MQQEPTESPEPQFKHAQLSETLNHHQHGSLRPEPSGRSPRRSAGSSSSSASPDSVLDARRDSADAVDADHLDERLRGLSLGPRKGGRGRSRPEVPGQRISDYENALTPPTPMQALGFKVVRRSDTSNDGTQIEDFPNGSCAGCLSSPSV